MNTEDKIVPAAPSEQAEPNDRPQGQGTENQRNAVYIALHYYMKIAHPDEWAATDAAIAAFLAAAPAAPLPAQPEQKQHHVDSDLVAWRIRIGTSDMWAWCETESDADFLGKQSGLKYEKQPLYAKPQQSGSIRSSAEPAGEVVSISASDGYATIGLYDDTIKVGDLVYAGAAPLPELTGPSAGSIGDAADFCGLLLELCESNLADGVAITERIIAYIDSRLAASPSPAPAQQPEPSAIESKLRDAVTILRGALVSAECAIKGREHTGFITKALVATEFVTAPSESAETAAPGASTEDKQ